MEVEDGALLLAAGNLLLPAGNHRVGCVDWTLGTTSAQLWASVELDAADTGLVGCALCWLPALAEVALTTVLDVASPLGDDVWKC